MGEMPNDKEDAIADCDVNSGAIVFVFALCYAKLLIFAFLAKPKLQPKPPAGKEREKGGRSRDSARVNPCEELLLVRCPLVLIMLRKHKNWVPIRNNKRWPAWPAHPDAAGDGDWHGGGGVGCGAIKGDESV